MAQVINGGVRRSLLHVSRMKRRVVVVVLMVGLSRADEVTLRLFCRAKNFRWVPGAKTVAFGTRLVFGPASRSTDLLAPRVTRYFGGRSGHRVAVFGHPNCPSPRLSRLGGIGGEAYHVHHRSGRPGGWDGSWAEGR
ncbi:hypothetical protein B0T11DRAFT_90586 [Plectosphaerella cucumerina]|uniref:Uncharacterized protein n=1 Tax=Plectosphaerella cucumerina TaxID=40658 RepID=A0A8K0TI09_9PEZI|nr:hypothetical protein B0T11DRAFT_90586 [Plectosphaerella cucumerina]